MIFKLQLMRFLQQKSPCCNSCSGGPVIKLKDVATKGVITSTSDDNFFYRPITPPHQRFCGATYDKPLQHVDSVFLKSTGLSLLEGDYKCYHISPQLKTDQNVGRMLLAEVPGCLLLVSSLHQRLEYLTEPWLANPCRAGQ